MQKFMSRKMTKIVGVMLAVAMLLSFTACSNGDTSIVAAGVELNSVPIGGKTLDEVSTILDEQIAQPKLIQIVVDGNQIELDLNSAGFSLDKEKTLAELQTIGKSNFMDGLKTRLFHKNVTGVVTSDREMFVTVVDTLLQTEGLSEKRFDYTIQNNLAEITLNPGVTCYDSEKLFETILAEYPNVQSLYSMEQTSTKAPTAEEIKNAINIEVIDARMEKVDGKITIFPHQVGLQIDETVLEEKLASGEPVFQVPVTVLNPKVLTDDLGDEAFPNRLSTYTTKYNEGEVSRSTNVKLAAKKVNGTILNSGDVFSFNQVVGKRTYENGFRDAKIFLADKVVDGTGGGICQVSSTIYPAVLYSNLKIVERRNHNFVVSYAKSGIDATVAYGSIDFKFQNNLQNPIRIKATAVNGNMTVEIWGTKENDNTVEITTETLGYTPRGTKYVYNAELPAGEQRVTQGGYDGVKVQSYRIVKDANGAVLKTENLGVSNYVSLVRIVETSDTALVPPEQLGEVLPETSPSIISPVDVVPPVPEITPVPTEGEVGETSDPAPVVTEAPSETPAEQPTENTIPTDSAPVEPVVTPFVETPAAEAPSEIAA